MELREARRIILERQLELEKLDEVKKAEQLVSKNRINKIMELLAQDETMAMPSRGVRIVCHCGLTLFKDNIDKHLRSNAHKERIRNEKLTFAKGEFNLHECECGLIINCNKINHKNSFLHMKLAKSR